MVTFSIITAVFNAAPTIRDCIESVRSQGQAVEHIIIDGLSTDGSLDIIEQYRSVVAKIVSEQDAGLYDGMNKGLRLATGDIIAILNADDVYASPDVLCKVADTFHHDEVDSCYGDLVYVDQQDANRITRYWRSGPYDYRRFYWGWMPPHPTFFARREVYEKHGLFDLRSGLAADYELILRFLVKHRISLIYIPEILVKMRTGGRSSVSLRNRLVAYRKDRLAWRVNGLRPYPWTLIFKPMRKVHQYFVR